MSNEKASQVQENETAWKKLVDDQVARTELAYAEVARIQEQVFAQNKLAIDEMAKLTKSSVDYLAELTNEWRKLTIEATKKATDFSSWKV